MSEMTKTLLAIYEKSNRAGLMSDADLEEARRRLHRLDESRRRVNLQQRELEALKK